eukprot:1160379-Pelagomonas_calceolata.AAC.13
MHHMPHLHPGEGAPATAALRAVTSCDSSTPIGPAASHDGISDSCLNGTLKEPSTVFESQPRLFHKDLKRSVMAHAVDQTINPAVAALKPSKTMALTDLALSMKEQGVDVSAMSS